MQLHPTRTAVDLALAGSAVVVTGLVAGQSAILAWGGAILVGLAIARGVTLLGVSRVRAAGFEMLWKDDRRQRRVPRGRTVELAAEVRNRDSRAARYVQLRCIASPMLDVEITPTEGEVPAGGRLRVSVNVTTARVGRHGIHGLSLEVRGSPGLFEIPLTFANPYGIEVVPAPYGAMIQTAKGGRSRTIAQEGRAGPVAGDGQELRELREHHTGDPFKKIAWKASARRGRLLVREHEREERDIVWLIVDASVELWAGEVGRAPLDYAIDEAASIAHAYLGRGDPVGLAVCADQLLAWHPPARGPGQLGRIVGSLVDATSTYAPGRSDLDEADAAALVLEHLRPIAPTVAQGLRARDFDRVAAAAAQVMSRAPFHPMDLSGRSEHDLTLRRYLSAFGIRCPPRLESDAAQTDAVLAECLRRAFTHRPAPSVVFLWAPAPDPRLRPRLFDALGRRPRRGIELRWLQMQFTPGIPRRGTLGAAVGDAVAIRTSIAERAGEHALRRLGIRSEPIRRPHRVARARVPGAAP